MCSSQAGASTSGSRILTPPSCHSEQVTTCSSLRHRPVRLSARTARRASASLCIAAQVQSRCRRHAETTTELSARSIPHKARWSRCSTDGSQRPLHVGMQFPSEHQPSATDLALRSPCTSCNMFWTPMVARCGAKWTRALCLDMELALAKPMTCGSGDWTRRTYS